MSDSYLVTSPDGSVTEFTPAQFDLLARMVAAESEACDWLDPDSVDAEIRESVVSQNEDNVFIGALAQRLQEVVEGVE